MVATIHDVAREAGVSRGTVSLVLRDSPLVASRTREHVQRTMRRLDYQPNQLAAGLRSKRSNILGLVVSDLTYPHYAQMAVGVEEAVEDAGYSLIVTNSRLDIERERRHVDTLRRYRADGLIVTPQELRADGVTHLRALREEGYPFVCLYREVSGLETDFCGTDVYGATRALVAYLAGDLGHRRIAVLSGRVANTTNAARIEGWRDELSARSLPPPEELIVVDAGVDRPAAEAVGGIIERRVAFTAILCVNDFLALDALRALGQAGKRVPEDVSVAGMGGLLSHPLPEKTLTTMVDNYRGIGRAAGELLLRRIDAGRTGAASPVERRVLPAQLRSGETTGPAYGAARPVARPRPGTTPPNARSQKVAATTLTPSRSTARRPADDTGASRAGRAAGPTRRRRRSTLRRDARYLLRAPRKRRDRNPAPPVRSRQAAPREPSRREPPARSRSDPRRRTPQRWS